MAPQLPTEGLRALAAALEADDPRLLQGATQEPLPLAGLWGWPVERACAVAYACWWGLKDPGAATVAQIEQLFATTCFDCDRALNEMAGCRWFLQWHDETPRAEMLSLLLEEVERELSRRRDADPATQPRPAAGDSDPAG